jgi:hypothetical protein
VHDKRGYFTTLKNIAEQGSGEIKGLKLERAKKYAYYFFFKRMIFLPWFKLDSSTNLSTIELDDIFELEPGGNKNLDAICEGILLKSPFEAPEIGL